MLMIRFQSFSAKPFALRDEMKSSKVSANDTLELIVIFFIISPLDS